MQTAVINRPAGRSRVRQQLLLGALGVVYGDIGTSPLYTIRQCFGELGHLSSASVYGVLSLITWALAIIVTLKYITVVMRADNRGEGGILALTALALRARDGKGRLRRWVLAAGLLGAALFYGDGVITPAISVLSAVEGLKVATPFFDSYVLPITVVLLLALFMMQRHGTGLVGGCFGPVMAVWFVTIGGLGLVEIVHQPEILKALNPYYGVALLTRHPLKGFPLLGAVVLAVTGVEALYADMGHFGRRAIRMDWVSFVFPALLLNYFGQGALLLRDPARSPTHSICWRRAWALYPLVAALGRGHRHRLAGGDLRRLLDDAPGGAVGLAAALPDPAHLRGGDRARSTCPRSTSSCWWRCWRWCWGSRARTISAPPTASPSPARCAHDRAGAGLHHRRRRLEPAGRERRSSASSSPSISPSSAPICSRSPKADGSRSPWAASSS